MSAPKCWMVGDLTVRAKHHESLEALWTTKWRLPCALGVYPFHDGKLQDFQPVFDHLIKVRLRAALALTAGRSVLDRKR